MYKINPKTIKIYNIDEKEIIDILSLEEFLKIIDFLNSKNVQPSKPINELYQKLRLTIYT